MCDYREWCRLCGSPEGTSEIQADVLNLIQTLVVNILLIAGTFNYRKFYSSRSVQKT